MGESEQSFCVRCQEPLPPADPTERTVKCPNCHASNDRSGGSTLLSSGASHDDTSADTGPVDPPARRARAQIWDEDVDDDDALDVPRPHPSVGAAGSNDDDDDSARVSPEDANRGNPRRDRPPHTDPLIGALLMDKYRVGECIGHGGMGRVYRGHDEIVDRPVAIKVVKEDIPDPVQLREARRRFEQEARIVPKLAHPHIIPVYDVGQTDRGDPFIVMMYAADPGQAPSTLQDLIEPGRGVQDVDWAMESFYDICSAVHAAHTQVVQSKQGPVTGIIHRDIKPANILVWKGSAYLSDFGIARMRVAGGGRGETSTGQGPGTRDYMAPEQRSGRDVDARTDVYSLGLVLYEMLTGVAMRGEPGAPPPPPVSKVRRALDGRIDRLIRRATAFAPNDRPATVEELARQVRLAVRPREALAIKVAKVAVVLSLVCTTAYFGYRVLRGGSGGAGGGSTAAVSPQPQQQPPPPSPQPLTHADLLAAVEARDAAAVRSILVKDPVLAASRGADGRSALHRAAALGATDVVAQLLAQNADVNAADPAGRSPLHDAADADAQGAALKLLQAGADRAAKDKTGRSPVDLASAKHFDDMVVILGRKDLADALAAADHAKVDALLAATPALATHQTRKEGLTLLHALAEAGDLQGMRVALKYNPPIDARTVPDGLTPLLLALRDPRTVPTDPAARDGQMRDRLDVVRELLQRGADPTIADRAGNTALDLATAKDTADAMRALVDRRIDVNKPNAAGKTPLLAACEGRKTEVACFLAGLPQVDADATIRGGQTALQIASAHADRAVVQALLARRPAPRLNAGAPGEPGSGATPLCLASKSVAAASGSPAGDAEVVRALLAAGADPNMADADGRTPLHVASSEGNTDVVNVLIDASSSIKLRLDTSSNTGNTPLLEAAAGGRVAVVEALLKAGAKPDLGNAKTRVTPRAVADAGRVAAVGRGQSADAQRFASTIALIDARLPKLPPPTPPPMPLPKKNDAAVVAKAQVEQLTATDVIKAVDDGDATKVRKMLQAQPDLAQTPMSGGRTLLHVAARGGASAELIGLLLDTGRIDVNARDAEGNTAAHIAAHEVRQEVWNVLVDRGARLDIKNVQLDGGDALKTPDQLAPATWRRRAAPKAAPADAAAVSAPGRRRQPRRRSRRQARLARARRSSSQSAGERPWT